MNKEKYKELERQSFEKVLEELEIIARRMSQGDMALKDMMDAYEKGMVLSEICSKKLKLIEKKIEILKSNSNGGRDWEDFDTDSSQTRESSSVSIQDLKESEVSVSRESSQEYNDFLF